MSQGRVYHLPKDKQFGFIKDSDGEEYFFHRDDFNGHWEDLIIDYVAGIKVPVEFEEYDSPKGPRARDVKRLDFPNQVDGGIDGNVLSNK